MEEHPMGTMLAKLEREPPPLRPRFVTPTGFERWVRRLLKKTPRNRFQRAADAAWALKGLAVEEEQDESGRLIVPSSSAKGLMSDTLIRGGLDTMS